MLCHVYLDADPSAGCHAVLRGVLHSPHYSRQVVQCEDGGTIALDWYEGSDTCQDADHGPSNPIVLVLHPLTGGHSSQQGQNPCAGLWGCCCAL